MIEKFKKHMELVKVAAIAGGFMLVMFGLGLVTLYVQDRVVAWELGFGG